MDSLNKMFQQGIDYLDRSKTYLDGKSKQCADVLNPEKFEALMQITINRNLFQDAEHLSDGSVRVREMKVSFRRSKLSLHPVCCCSVLVCSMA